MKYTDKQLLDFLQKKNRNKAAYTDECLFWVGKSGAWMLYMTCLPGSKKSVREAIGDAIDREKNTRDKSPAFKKYQRGKSPIDK